MKKTFPILVMSLTFALILVGCTGANDGIVFDLEQRFQGESSGVAGSAEAPGGTNSADVHSSNESSLALPEVDARNVIVIGERFFVNQMFEIFLNHQQYIDRVVQYEGLFRTIEWNGLDFYIVYRYMLGCCGEEERIGFEVVMDGFEPFADDAWVEVVGVLDTDDGFLVLRVISITEMDERGLTFVS